MNSRWSKNVIRSAVPLSRVIADLTGQQPGKRGRETLVRCPFHHDTKPSLRINDEKGVWTCDPCGVGGDLFKFVMQLEGLTFPESVAFLGNRYQAGSVAQQGPGRGGAVTDTYNYRSESGELLYQVLRTDAKQFLARRPDGHGGWIWNLDNTRRILYRLLEIQGESTVYVPEGERDVAALVAIGLPATTSPGGASKSTDPTKSKWLDSYTTQLTDAGVQRVVVLPDNDEAGRRHAQTVSTKCYGAGLTVKVVELPVGDKGDVTDFLADHSKQELADLVMAAPQYVPEPAGSATSTPVPRSRPTSAWPAPLEPAALHGMFGDLVALVAPETEADPASLLLTALVAFGNVIGRRAYFMVGATRHHVNLFALLVGDTAKARKGTSLHDIFRFFRQVDEVWVGSRVLSGLSSGEGLIWAVRDPIEKQRPVKQNGRIVGYETVIEDHGVEDKRLLVIESEFANTLKVIRRDGNTLSPTVRQAWDGGILNTMTKNSPAKATDAHVSILGHITSFELQFGGTEVQNGFANRFLIACAKRSRLLPEGGRLDEKNVTEIVHRLRAAINWLTEMATPLVLRRDEEARRLWWAVYPQLSSASLGVLGMVTARAEAQVTRLSCLYALGDRSPVVRVEHLKASLALWRYCFESARPAP